MAEINVEFVSFYNDRPDPALCTGLDMLRREVSLASRKTVTTTALGGSDRITVPAGYTTALVTALGAAIRVSIGADPTAVNGSATVLGSNLVLDEQVLDFPVKPGELISAILNVAL